MPTEEKREDRHPWRENIEAITMAIAVALLFKLFILEISKIPSGSMQPTLMGSPEAEVFDRIIVDKLSFSYRDPERYEIVVFDHPLERSRVMVKRLVGMPGEQFKIEHGDLWRRPLDADGAAGADAWTILRRPQSVKDEMWKRLEALDRTTSSWRAVDGGGDWRFTGRSILARGDGVARFRPDEPSITNRYTDGYPDQVRGDLASHASYGDLPVGDLRLEGEVTMASATEFVTIRLTEGERAYEFRLPGPAAPDDATATIVVREDEGLGEREIAAPEPWRAAADETVPFAVENMDDLLSFEIDGATVLTEEIRLARDQRSTVSIEVKGPRAELDDLRLYRDVYYFWPRNGTRPWIQTIPEGNYVMLGDNTQDSADSRDWKSTSRTWKDADGVERSERGNFRAGVAQPNPIPWTTETARGEAFRDRWGDLHWLTEPFKRSLEPKDEPLVPRELVHGRALAIFWPISIGRKMWRRGWLH